MKKLSCLLLGAAGLLMVSCSQDDLENPALNGDGNYNITVKLPGDFRTRAFGDGKTAENLHIAVYDAVDNALIDTKNVTFGGQIYTVVPLTLVNGRSYKIAFFAQSPASENVYKFNAEAKEISVEYAAMNSNYNTDAYDCFYQLHETGKIGTDTQNTTVLLNRPVAQVNWGTDDLNDPAVTNDNVYGENASKLVSKVSAQAYTTFDMMTGDVKEGSEKATVALNYLARPASTEEFPVKKEDLTADKYEYLSMHYLLIPKSSDVIDLVLTVNNDDTSTDNEHPITVASAPVQANYRTNIYGSLLTNPTNYTVIKDKNWGDEDTHIVYGSQGFREAVAAGGTVVLNDDIALETNKRVMIDKDVVIDLNGHKITGPDGGEDADGALLATNGANVVITGNGEMETTGTYASILVWADGGSTITIENGTFTGKADGEVIYVGDGGGTINIKGGRFICANGDEGLLNIHGTAVANGTGHINVTGGVFCYDFDPANNDADGSGTNYVVDGYVSVPVTINGRQAYAVVPQGTTPVIKENTTQMSKGGTFTLVEDVKYASQNYLPLTKNTTIDLNGYELNTYGAVKTYGDGVVVGNGAEVKLSNGVINPSDNASAEKGSATINLMTSGGGKLTLENVTVSGGPAYAVAMTSANEAAQITISSGTYYSEDVHGCAIYCGTKVTGNIMITGGTFGRPGYPADYLLNLEDVLRAKPANQYITVKGGTFINFNPADCRSEGQHTNFVAPGYKVVAKSVGSDMYYTVVPE